MHVSRLLFSSPLYWYKDILLIPVSSSIQCNQTRYTLRGQQADVFARTPVKKSEVLGPYSSVYSDVTFLLPELMAIAFED